MGRYRWRRKGLAARTRREGRQGGVRGADAGLRPVANALGIHQRKALHLISGKDRSSVVQVRRVEGLELTLEYVLGEWSTGDSVWRERRTQWARRVGQGQLERQIGIGADAGRKAP